MRQLYYEIKRMNEILFPKAKSLHNGLHLQKEAKEFLAELQIAKGDVPQNLKNIVEEAADCMILVLGALGKYGITYGEVSKAMSDKVSKNYRREWEENEDGTYSHIYAKKSYIK